MTRLYSSEDKRPRREHPEVFRCDDPIFSRLLRLDDDYRIDETVTVSFSGRVGRIEQSYTVDEKLISIPAGC